ncbi:Ig-like domain-containing protein [Taibaiella koreensis]|uniref:Ig-like domain-containing protein n=1 Tax=Taibaiella koreensis TaxID=1268548 RepID=UPI0013C3386A|nr:T9SS type A sorting domain-containing protein [Taibaiella koreensis]
MKTTFCRYLKNTIFPALLMVITLQAQAQVPASSYTFSAQAGTFTALSGATDVPEIESDEDISDAIPIGFTFSYCNNTYTEVVASSNGWLSFGSPSDAVSYNDASSLNDVKPALFPLWQDLGGDAGSASYTTTGTAPNRVFTFEFKNWYWSASAANPVISFQVRLYETTNVIEYCYKQETGTISGWSPLATIGIVDGDPIPSYLTLNNATASATASSTTFNVSISSKPANGQIFRFTPPPNCSGGTFPAATAAVVSPVAVCVSGNVDLSLATPMPILTGLSYKWQYSETGTAPWTDVGPAANLPTQSAPVTTPRYFRCLVLCNGGTTPVWTSGNSPQVLVNNPGSPTATAGTRCGPGAVQLSATGTAGGPLIKWYANATGGAPIGNTSTWTTPYIPTTTTFYVTAGSPDVAGSKALGAGLEVTMWNDLTPFVGWDGGFKHQFLIHASELEAMGLEPGATITSMALDVVTAGNTYNDFSVALKNTTTAAFLNTPSALEGGAIQVYTPASHTTTTGLNNFVFNSGTPFIWNGDNLLVQTCWSNNNSSNTTSEVRYDEVSFNATQYGNGSDMTAAVFCDAPPNIGWTSFEARPRMVFGYTASCQGPRVPVVATVTASPALTVTAPDVICNGTIAPIVVTPQGTPYTTYKWNEGDIYTDAAATVPYVAVNSATSLFFKAADAGEHVYYLMAENTTSHCTFADTVRIWNQPGTVTTKAVLDTLCNSGESTISLIPGSGYFPGSITWMDSPDGTTYTPIAGASDPSYTTPTITDTRFYKVIIKAGTADCHTLVQQVVVAHPEVVSTKDSSRCGPGVVTLEAEAGGNAVIRWYDDPAAIDPIGSGSPFNTPYLGTTTTFYASAATGSPQPEPTMIGNGTFTSSWTEMPYNLDFSANKVQWLIKASALHAAGFNAGYINSIGFDVASAGDEVENFSLSMKLTTANMLGPNLETGLQTVFSTPSYQPVSDMVNVHNLTSLFYWDGTSNIVLEECHNNEFDGWSSDVTYTNGSTAMNSADEADHCTNPTGPTNTSSDMPVIQVGMVLPCETAKEPVVATVHPVPVVDLGTNVNNCVDPGQEVLVLDAGLQPNSGVYLWDDASVEQVRAVHQSGTYWVKVTNEYSCVKADTIDVNFRINPVVQLGNDTSICNGAVLKLDGGSDGIDYFWSTGAATKTINVSTAGTYYVFVTNNAGCIKSDTITVSTAGQLPKVDGIVIDNNGVNTFSFSAVNPQNVIGYDWDFGDGSPHSNLVNPVHTYDVLGEYVVVLKMSSSCGFATDSLAANMVGIKQLNVSNDEMMVYPNPTRASATIQNKGALKMEKIQVYNVLGQVIYDAKADSKDKHTLKLDGFASGVYTIEIFTDKGMVARKLELMR